MFSIETYGEHFKCVYLFNQNWHVGLTGDNIINYKTDEPASIKHLKQRQTDKTKLHFLTAFRKQLLFATLCKSLLHKSNGCNT